MSHRNGSMEPFDADRLDALIAELDGPPDPDHPDVAVAHDDGWSLSAFPSGRLIWENLEGQDQPRHATGVQRSDIRRLLLAVGQGELATVDAFEWSDGYGE